MNPDHLNRIEAHIDICNLKSRFLRAVDLGDLVLLETTLDPTVVIDFSEAATDPSTGVDHADGRLLSPLTRDEFLAMILANRSRPHRPVHHVSVPEISFQSPDQAFGIWPMSDRVITGESTNKVEVVGFGYYAEEYAKSDGVWKIKRLKLTRSRIDILKFSSN